MEDNRQIIIDGKPYTADDLTFREQRELRTQVRALLGDPAADLDDAAVMDFIPAIVYVVKRRDDPEFTMDQALDMEFGDVLREPDPTKSRAKKPPRETAGPPK